MADVHGAQNMADLFLLPTNWRDVIKYLVTYSHERPPYWEVTALDGRWWSVSYNPDKQTYLITNYRGSILNPHGPTGQKVLDAVYRYDRQ